MKKQYNQPAVYTVDMMPQMTLMLSGGGHDMNDPQGPVWQI